MLNFFLKNRIAKYFFIKSKTEENLSEIFIYKKFLSPSKNHHKTLFPIDNTYNRSPTFCLWSIIKLLNNKTNKKLFHIKNIINGFLFLIICKLEFPTVPRLMSGFINSSLFVRRPFVEVYKSWFVEFRKHIWQHLGLSVFHVIMRRSRVDFLCPRWVFWLH